MNPTCENVGCYAILPLTEYTSPQGDSRVLCPRHGRMFENGDRLAFDASDEFEQPQTAMLLTEREWLDVAEMVDHFRCCTDWVTREPENIGAEHVNGLRRKRDLAERIMQASLPGAQSGSSERVPS